MAQDQHKNLTGTDLHESKGVASASSGTVYKADGAGSGSWVNLLASTKNNNLMTFCGQFTNLSAAASSIWLPMTTAGKITAVYVTLQNAITVANATVTVKIAGVTATGGSITVTQAGSAAGSIFSCTPSAANTVTAGSALEIHSDGGSTTACVAYVTVLVDVT